MNFDDKIKRMLGTTKKFGGKNDLDGDGVPNRKDCQPRNTMRQDKQLTPQEWYNKAKRGDILIEQVKKDQWATSAWIAGPRHFGKPILLDATQPGTLTYAKQAAKDFQRYHKHIKFKIIIDKQIILR